MFRAWHRVGFLFVLSLVLAVPVASAVAPPPYATTSLTASGVAKETIAGFTGVGGNYTNTNLVLSGALVFVYVDVTNALNQNVYAGATTTTFSSTTASFFVPFVGLPSGTYQVAVFATTSDGVPISTPVHVQVVL
ncbi:MAG: hypothetical protein OK438_03095 [Thaumarchaeota archaeon]|nr:hypothetical protein [Nitrososphaerota archaeon]